MLARNSCGEPYECKRPWPESCFVQCGEKGIVVKKGTLEGALTDPAKALEALETVVGLREEPESYRTAFFEAFPRDPNTFLRGEGKTVEEAETSAWRQYERFTSCQGHEFERRGYTNGAGFCKHCNMFSGRVFSEEDSGD